MRVEEPRNQDGSATASFVQNDCRHDQGRDREQQRGGPTAGVELA
jgi:hypothetical protein